MRWVYRTISKIALNYTARSHARLLDRLELELPIHERKPLRANLG